MRSWTNAHTNQQHLSLNARYELGAIMDTTIWDFILAIVIMIVGAIVLYFAAGMYAWSKNEHDTKNLLNDDLDIFISTDNGALMNYIHKH